MFSTSALHPCRARTDDRHPCCARRAPPAKRRLPRGPSRRFERRVAKAASGGEFAANSGAMLEAPPVRSAT
eukprot:479046-Prorocentrum_minimum.AAC.1